MTTFGLPVCPGYVVQMSGPPNRSAAGDGVVCGAVGGVGRRATVPRVEQFALEHGSGGRTRGLDYKRASVAFAVVDRHYVAHSLRRIDLRQHPALH
jgi:hypothetical protein